MSFVPVNEWQVCAFRHDQRLGLVLIMQPIWKSTVTRVWEAADIPFLFQEDSTHRNAHFFVDHRYYVDAQQALEKHEQLREQVLPLPLPLQNIVRRQDDPVLFDVQTPDAIKERWARMPPHIVKELKDYQKQGVEFLWRNRGRGMICDEMGTGKSLQSIAFMHSTDNEAEDFPLLIVCPRSVRGNWRDEWWKWSRCKDPGEVVLVTDTRKCLELLGGVATPSKKSAKNGEDGDAPPKKKRVKRTPPVYHPDAFSTPHLPLVRLHANGARPPRPTPELLVPIRNDPEEDESADVNSDATPLVASEPHEDFEIDELSISSSTSAFDCLTELVRLSGADAKSPASSPTANQVPAARVNDAMNKRRHEEDDIDPTKVPKKMRLLDARASSNLSTMNTTTNNNKRKQSADEDAEVHIVPKTSSITTAPSAKNANATARPVKPSPTPSKPVRVRASNHKVYVFTYELLIRPDVRAAVIKFGFPSMIFDECHKLKSRDSQRSKVCTELSRSCKRLVLLSGTPGSRPAEMYPQLCIVHPWMFPTYFKPYPMWIKKVDTARTFDREIHNREKWFDYGRRYNNPQPQFIPGAIIKWTLKGNSRLDELAAVLQHFLFIRRTKQQVLPNLRPIKRRRILFHLDDRELADSERDLQLLAEYKERNPRKYDTHFMDIFNNRLPRLKMPVVERFITEWFTEMPTGAYFRHILPALHDVLEDIAPLANIVTSYLTQPKVLLFAHHVSVLKAADELLTRLGVPHVFIYGQTPADDRDRMIKQFQNDNTIQAAVLGLTALNAGVNLDAAEHVIFLEQYWTPEIMLQSEARAHRFNTKGDVWAWYLILLKTMDELMWQNLEHKQATAVTLVDKPTSASEKRQEQFLQDGNRRRVSALPSQAVMQYAH